MKSVIYRDPVKNILTQSLSNEKLAPLTHCLDSVKINDKQRSYEITLIHAEDDYDILWSHSNVLFCHDVNATFVSSLWTTFELPENPKTKENPL
jgi:abhydrolase domain-containing protein 12